MSGDARDPAAAAVLRQAFDRTFAAPAHLAVEDSVDLLALRVGGDGYAVHLGDVGGLLVDRRLVPVTATLPEFLGLTGVKGVVVPVWSLGALLGYGADRELPRWLVVTSGRSREQALALACERFEGHLRVPRARLSESAATESRPGAHGGLRVRHSLRTDDGPRGVLDFGAIADDIRRRLGLPAGKDDETGNEAL